VNLQTRVVNILTKPGDEWPIIAAEPATVATVYSGYVMILAAIPAVCSLIGSTVFGITLPIIGTYRVGLAQGLATMVLSYVMALAGVYIAALVIQKLAPTFQSDADLVQAFKLVTYSMTAPWVAGVLNIIPALGLIVVLAAIYGIYLCYLGMTPVMKTPQDKVIPYMAVSAVVVIVVNVVLGGILGVLVAVFWAAPRVGM
jgi:Yip1 domain